MTPVIEAVDVAFAYGQTAVLQGVTFSVDEGEFVALVGPNGSGKSTLLRILLGLVEPDRGRAAVFGRKPSDLGEKWRIGYVPQRAAVSRDLPATVAEVILAGRLGRRRFGRVRPVDRDELAHALSAVGLEDFAGRRIGELSGGEQQRAMIARALVAEPEVLVLDEPVAGVDSDSQQSFRDALVHLQREHSVAILLVSHELSAVADDLDRVVVLQSGRVSFDGPPSELTAAGVSLGVHRHDLPVWLEGKP
jgi:zinc transport system ATP-binding protein